MILKLMWILCASDPTFLAFLHWLFLCQADSTWDETCFSDCSGVHRSLGVHRSKVRSLTLDAWEPVVLQVMEELGNTVVNKIYEANVGPAVQRITPNCKEWAACLFLFWVKYSLLMSSVTVDKTWLFVDDGSHLVTSEITRITLLSSLKINLYKIWNLLVLYNQ